MFTLTTTQLPPPRNPGLFTRFIFFIYSFKTKVERCWCEWRRRKEEEQEKRKEEEEEKGEEEGVD